MIYNENLSIQDPQHSPNNLKHVLFVRDFLKTIIQNFEHCAIFQHPNTPKHVWICLGMFGSAWAFLMKITTLGMTRTCLVCLVFS